MPVRLLTVTIIFCPISLNGTPPVTDGRQDVKLRRGKVELRELVLEFLIRRDVKTKKTQPQASGIARKEWPFIGGHGLNLDAVGRKATT
jgi:hypothetical protein